jgi:3-hydroxybutyryl-CoA dehydratase
MLMRQDCNPLLSARQMRLEEIQPGRCVSFSIKIGDADVAAFAALTGDRSPIHMSDDAARESGFAGRIVHGMLIASYSSVVVGMLLPGRNGVLVSCNADFLEPVALDAELILSARVRQASRAARLIKISVSVHQSGLVVMKGLITASVRSSRHADN